MLSHPKTAHTALHTLIVLGLVLVPLVGRTDGFTCSVSRVVDGDTFHCTSGVKVRISGINAPEIDETYGPVSKGTLVGLIEGATVTCEPTGTTHDRIAAVCYLAGQDIGAMMVERAMARDCPRYSGGRYAGLEDERHDVLPAAGFCAE